MVDDASTDATHQIARQRGARTLQVALRKISAVRNAGARVAMGEVLFFVDADTVVNERAVSAALAALRAGAVGGGCAFDFSGPAPLWGTPHSFLRGGSGAAPSMGGRLFPFLYSRSLQYFSERLYAGEDIAFVQALKKVERFVVLKPKVLSSPRKLNVVSRWQVLGLMLIIAIRGPRYESQWVLDILYGQRAQDSKKPIPTSPGAVNSLP